MCDRSPDLIIRDRVERIWRFRRIRRNVMHGGGIVLPASIGFLFRLRYGQLSRYVYGNLIGCDADAIYVLMDFYLHGGR